MTQPLVVAIVGAESTGKTALAAALAGALRAAGHASSHVPEVLRAWCDAAGRTPLAHEQEAIARAQAASVQGANEKWVIADTTPLMTAVYSELLFGDTSLYPFALAHQRLYRLTLLTGLDLPWVADGLQRDGPQVRGPVDRLLRAQLQAAAIPYQVIYGQGEARLRHALGALQALAPGLAEPSAAAATAATATLAASAPGTKPGRPRPWVWACEKCSDPECEHRLFSRLDRGAPR